MDEAAAIIESDVTLPKLYTLTNSRNLPRNREVRGTQNRASALCCRSMPERSIGRGLSTLVEGDFQLPARQLTPQASERQAAFAWGIRQHGCLIGHLHGFGRA